MSTLASPTHLSTLDGAPGGTGGGVTGLTRLTWRLTTARFAAREGESLLYVAGVFAYTVAAALALTVAGGTWMFWNRWQHPTGLIARVLTEDATFSEVLMFYFALAVIACALLVPALVNLAAGAAVLGARGRERRLAVLRLVGLSSGDVTRMSLFDALIQSVLGTVLGAAAYLATLPLWHNITMLGMPLTFEEMLLPTWLFALTTGAVVFVGLWAAWRGLRQVRISPLGVARRANKPRLSRLRALVLILAVAGTVIAVNVLRPGSQLVTWIVLGAVILGLVGAMNLAGPWMLQVSARAFAHLPGPTVRWAARRIVAEPAATWRRVAGLAVLSFIGGYMALMPITLSVYEATGPAMRTLQESALYDFTVGVLITLGVGFALTAASMLVTQASATIERAEQSRALHKMGAPEHYSLRVMWVETFAPLVLAVVTGTLLGVLLGLPMYQAAVRLGLQADSGVAMIAGVLAAGLVLAAAALGACHPLHHRILGAHRRRND